MSDVIVLVSVIAFSPGDTSSSMYSSSPLSSPSSSSSLSSDTAMIHKYLMLCHLTKAINRVFDQLNEPSLFKQKPHFS